tara:strand:- start:272 stop:463 length:192 start_codon:yes stop_codon:yes gene_type:complete
MEIKDLIKELKKLPQDLPIRTLQDNVPDDMPNEWVFKVELHETCVADSDKNNVFGEVVLITSQ